MSKIELQDLLKARVHLGHQTRNWNPKMAPFLFAEKDGIHIIDLNKTVNGIEKTCESLKNIVESGRKIMFVATKRQASSLVEEYAQKLKQPFVTERWLGGTLTNFSTIRRSLKKLANINKIKKSITYQNLAKREKLMLQREQTKLERLLKGMVDINRIPSALFVIDIKNESIAVQEANKLGIPVFAIVDTNSDPSNIDCIIPANDDSYSSINIILKSVSEAIEKGLENRKKNKESGDINKIENKKTNDLKKITSKRIVKKVTSTDDIKTEKNSDKSKTKVIKEKNKPKEMIKTKDNEKN
ncbi:MAG: 30S ribosomal protein S2 [Bacteroidetes bacterium]|nr:30S ribosomal protein S2 [Bacteroidota bacterium]